VNWTVALISNSTGESVELGGWDVNPLTRARHPEDSGDAANVYRIRRLVSPTDEMLDLTQGQQGRALEHTRSQYQEQRGASRHRVVPRRPSGPNIRRVRDPRNGLLLLYPLLERDDEGCPFVGFAASFPHAGMDTPVEYVVNTVYWEQEEFAL
jgi:hypothetical protein